MKLSDLLATCGNGCDGSRPTGTSSGRTWRLEEAVDPARARAALRSAWLRMRMPLAASAGITSSLKTRVLLVDQRVRLGGERLDVGGGDAGAGRRDASRQSAKRTSKNSSRLDETMQT